MNDEDFRTFDEMVSVLARNTPHALVLDWWRRLERTLDYYFIAFHRRSRPKNYIGILASDERVDSRIVSIVDGLRRRRNTVAHCGVQDLSPDDAVGFAKAAWLTVWAIGSTVPDALASESGAARMV